MGKLGLFIEEITEKTTKNNQYEVLTSSQNGIISQEEYFNKQIASVDNIGYKIIRRGQFTYRSMSDTGRFYINRLINKEVGIVSPAYPVFKLVGNKLDPEYLELFFQSEAFQRQISDKSSGSTRLALRFSKLENVEIDVPSIEIQRKIVDTVKRLKATINTEDNELVLCDELIKSRFNEMFGGNKSLVKIGDVLSTTSGGTPSKGKNEYYLNGDIPWLCSGEVNAGIITEVKNRITELGLKNSSAKWIPENSVVVAMYGATAGKVGLLKIKTTTNQAVCSILSNSKFIPEFLYYAVGSKTEELVSKAWGGAQPNISQGIIKNTLIPNPTIDEQKDFASFVTRVDKLKFSVVEKQKRAHYSSISRLSWARFRYSSLSLVNCLTI